MLVDYYQYKEQSFVCNQCRWTGRGGELSHGEFHEISMIGDLECPKCSHLIAFWSASLPANHESKKEK